MSYTTVVVKTVFDSDGPCTIAALREFLARWDDECTAEDAEQTPVRVSLGIFGLAAITSIQAEVPGAGSSV